PVPTHRSRSALFRVPPLAEQTGAPFLAGRVEAQAVLVEGVEDADPGPRTGPSGASPFQVLERSSKRLWAISTCSPSKRHPCSQAGREPLTPKSNKASSRQSHAKARPAVSAPPTGRVPA
ncbi:hypothetical protein, partial [Streptomyces sp. NPDC058629]|uniref:hypothetical protein n=1 Tax=Streptomyces sp. NPDC058629 TaxID=3346565 RepID=UPI003648A32C